MPNSPASQVSRENLLNIFLGTTHYKEKKYSDALKHAFLEADVQLKDDPTHKLSPAGCTSVVSYFSPEGELYVANAGDSRCVLSRKGTAIAMSEDHKPTLPDEVKRIRAAGGYVDFGRVNGNLALSRAIGDFEFKKSDNLPAEEQVVTSNPDVKQITLEKDDEFLVMACDGIWDVRSSEWVTQYVRERIGQGLELTTIAENLCDECTAKEENSTGLGCDNMTVVIVGILNGQSREEWEKKIRDNVGPLSQPLDA